MTAWPTKSREIHTHHFDSTVWNNFRFREDDIVIATYAKAGTTWMQQIVAQLLFKGAPHVDVANVSPWLDLRFPPKDEKLLLLERQRHRRFIKTHLPVDALVFSPKAKYVYVGRDGRDVVLSMHNHHSTATPEWYAALNDTPGRVGPPMLPPDPDVRAYFRTWLERDGYPFWPFWSHVKSWWDIRKIPNMHLVHFADLKNDLSGEIRRLAAFLEIEVGIREWSRILKHCSFDYMKRHSDKVVPLNGIFWKQGARSFIHRGVNGRWRAVLTEDDVLRYRREAIRHLPIQCVEWLEHGKVALERAPLDAGADERRTPLEG
jgi:aryl sulfotransferase